MKLSKILSFTFLLTLLVSTLQIRSALAGDCFTDPIYEHDWTGAVTTGAFVRDVACMEGSTVLTTLAVGSTIAVTGETDGWWRVQLSDGTEGWVGDWLLAVTEAPVSNATPTSAVSSPIVSLSATAAAGIRTRTTGYILLQVEEHGEAWYVDPLSGNRFYLADGPTAYEMMRTFGLGMTEADYAKLAGGDSTLTNRLLGRIVLRVEALGEAYYIHPDGTVYYLADGPAAYTLMREHSLGITNLDLTALTPSELELMPYGATGLVLGVHNEPIVLSEYQAGDLPDNFDIAELNRAWLELTNQERATRGVAPLQLDQGLVDTATNWAGYMGQTGNFTHTKPYGESLLAWVQGSYETTDFGENLAHVYVTDSAAGMQQIIKDSMSMFISEAGYAGMHYQNVIDADWGVTGVGFYFSALGPDSYQVYAVYHFASLN